MGLYCMFSSDAEQKYYRHVALADRFGVACHESSCRIRQFKNKDCLDNARQSSLIRNFPKVGSTFFSPYNASNHLPVSA